MPAAEQKDGFPAKQAVDDDAPVMRMNPRLFGLTLGLFSGGGLFCATLWLVVKGGENVGAHLGILGQYFPGYRVTFAGAWIGFGYAFAAGLLFGWLMGWVYNRLASGRGRT